MVKEKRIIGLVFTGNENWIGGLYYIVNIIRGINYLPDDEKPNIILLYNNKTSKSLLTEIEYPFVKQVNLDDIFILRRLIYSFLFRLIHKNFLFRFLVRKYNIQLLYPFNEYHSDLEFLPCKVLYWIFDFQHKFLPKLFSNSEIIRRDKEFELMTKFASDIVVSSNTAKLHFNKFYPAYKGNLHVLRFVSIPLENMITPFSILKETYNIDKPYFLVSNQFWIHKNHWVVLKAIKQLKKTGHKCLFIFTGKEHDPRNPDYVDELKEYIRKNDIESSFRFLGFISRENQLGLMKNCEAVVQPSKFEGWGTVVEDAKSIQKPVILSDIEIHREQMTEAIFFAPDDHNKLAEEIVKFNSFKGKYESISNIDRYIDFSKDFMKIIQ